MRNRNNLERTQGDSVAEPDSVSRTSFESISPEKTGIEFGLNWTPPPGYQLEIYRRSLPGGGVCVGDYDNDRWPDVFLTQPNIGSRLYRNLGGLRFQNVPEGSDCCELPNAMGATFVDIENDGDLDLFVCNNNHPNQLFINDGNRGFKEAGDSCGLGFRGASITMAFADYDRDGDLEIGTE